MGRKQRQKALLAPVQAAGIVGAGGAGFPTHVKLASKADVIIANGAECEPLLEVDGQLLTYHLEDVLTGLEAAQEAVGAECAYLAVKAKHKPLVEKLRQVAAIRSWPKIISLPDVYPIGDEQILVHEVLGRIVPPGGLPLQVGAVVINIETLYNIARALAGEPVTATYLTVHGAVAEPFTTLAPIGTAVGDILALARPLPAPDDFAVIEGGPMMGHLIHDLRQPVTKTTKGLVVLPKDHIIVTGLQSQGANLRRAYSVCSQCTKCTDLCPRHMLGHPLWPHRIMRGMAQGRPQGEIALSAFLCSECGICDNYACFMGLSPRQVNRRVKAWLLAEGLGKPSFTGLDQARDSWPRGRVPTSRLVYRLDLARWVKPAPLRDSLPAPTSVEIPLKQHVGVTAQPIVRVGDPVSLGSMVAQVPDGLLGAAVHSSIEGIVSSVSDRIITIRRGGEGG